jgi:hypothetical protein
VIAVLDSWVPPVRFAVDLRAPAFVAPLELAFFAPIAPFFALFEVFFAVHECLADEAGCFAPAFFTAERSFERLTDDLPADGLMVRSDLFTTQAP